MVIDLGRLSFTFLFLFPFRFVSFLSLSLSFIIFVQQLHHANIHSARPLFDSVFTKCQNTHTHTCTLKAFPTCVSVTIFCIHKLIQRIESGMQTKDKCLSNICLLSFSFFSFSSFFSAFRIQWREWNERKRERKCVREEPRGESEQFRYDKGWDTKWKWTGKQANEDDRYYRFAI